jgi:hypothetical protein
MASLLLGSCLSRLLTHTTPAILPLTCASSTGIIALAGSILYALHDAQTAQHTHRLMLVCKILSLKSDCAQLISVLCSYEICVGVYFSSVSRLQARILRSVQQHQATIMALVRVPTYGVAGVALILLHSTEVASTDIAHAHILILIFTAVLLALSTGASFGLLIVYRKQRPALVDGSAATGLLVRGADEIDDDDDDDVFQ